MKNKNNNMKYFFMYWMTMIFLLSSNSLFLYSQKLETENVFVKYVRLPTINLPNHVETYSLELQGKKMKIGENPTYDYSLLMQSYKRVDSDGDIVIKIDKVDSTRLVGIKERSFSEDTNNDEKLESYKYYNIEIQLPYWILEMKTKENTVYIDTLKYKNENTYFDKKKYFKTSESLNVEWDKNKVAFIERYRNIKPNIDWFSNIAHNSSLMYAFFNADIHKISYKKYSYEDFAEGVKEFKKGLEFANQEVIATTNILLRPKVKEQKIHLNKAVNIWESILNEKDLKKKSARINKKVTNIIYLQLACAYWWLEDFENANLYLSKSQELNSKKYEKDHSIIRLRNFIYAGGKRFKKNQWRDSQLEQMPENDVIENYAIVENELVLADKHKASQEGGIKIGINKKEILNVAKGLLIHQMNKDRK